jgi:C-terminal processing protease CtpA/Prc
MILAELSDGRVIVTDVFPGYPADFEGIAVGAEIITWDGQPVKQALDAIEPYFGPYSTEHHKQVEKAIFLTRYPVNTDVEITYQNPGGSEVDTVLTAEVDYDSLFAAYPSFTLDEMGLPLEAEVLDESGLGYIRITTFSDDYALMATMWERFIQNLIDNDIPGVILDLRINGGGSGALASDFAGYFFDEEIEVYQRSYYNELLGEWEYGEFPATIEPGPLYYDGNVAVLVSPTCVSACEGFAAMLTENNRATIVGHYATAGAFGEVGRGQYDMPDGYSMQFPTGRPETMDGDLYIEDVGVVPDIVVPVTEESALGQIDAVLQAAIDELR